MREAVRHTDRSDLHDSMCNPQDARVYRRELRFRLLALVVSVAVAITIASAQTRAQGFATGQMQQNSGAPGTLDELRAFGLVESQDYIEARGVAESILEQNPNSHVAHFVLAQVQQRGEANFPRALFHMRRAMELFEAQHGSVNQPAPWPWLWHARYLRARTYIDGDIGNHEDTIRYMQAYNENYQPRMIAEQAWPLMKLRRLDEARQIARAGIATGDRVQIMYGYNALCAIEFEAGNEDASFTACRQALDIAEAQGAVTTVDLTNFAEAERTVFQLDASEQTLLRATETGVSWYGNPWLELAELYTRGARYAEALDALKRIADYRNARPPEARNSDRNATRRATAGFLLAVGRPREALEITRQAVLTPDRRAHTSRDPYQDRAVLALLDRRARLEVIQKELEDAAGAGVAAWLESRLAVTELTFEAWKSGRRAMRELAEEDRLVGFFRVGSHSSGITPPWLLGDIPGVVGPGVATAAIDDSRATDVRAGAADYYDAFLAFAAFDDGDMARVLELGRRALPNLGRSEGMLRARLLAVMAEANFDETGETADYERAMNIDPGVFRLLGLSIPVRFEVSGGEVAEVMGDAADDSPRFEEEDDAPFVVSVSDSQICLRGTSTNFGCGQVALEDHNTPEEAALAAVREFHAVAFSPRIDLSQATINGLDGSPSATRDPLGDLGLTP